MNALLFDRDGAASKLAAEGSLALGIGETEIAAKKYFEAGALLEKGLVEARKPADLHLLRFLAATQYYRGGHYSKAEKLSKRIDTRYLPRDLDPTWQRFQKDLRFRAAPGYVERMRLKLGMLSTKGKPRAILEHLKEHPYLYKQDVLAFLRGSLCEELGQWKAAAAFYAAAIQCAEDGSDYVLMTVGRVLSMPSEGRLEEAWEFISRLREKMPNSVTNLVASITCFHRASKLAGEDRLAIHRQQIKLFEEGWATFKLLPEDRKNSEDLRWIVSIGFRTANMALMRLGDYQRAGELIEEEIEFDPNDPGPLSARGMLNYPSERALADFRKAIELPHPGYVPFVYLAREAFLQKKDLAEAERLTNEALSRQPGPAIQARLYSWLAMIRHCRGADQVEVESLFDRGLQIDPHNRKVWEAYKQFENALEAENSDSQQQWGAEFHKDFDEPNNPIWKASEESLSSRKNRRRDQLLAGAP